MEKVEEMNGTSRKGLSTSKENKRAISVLLDRKYYC